MRDDPGLVKTVPLHRLASRLTNRLHQFFARHLLRRLRARHVINLFLDHRAVNVVHAVAQRHLRELHAHQNPVRLDVVDVVQIDAGNRQRLEQVVAARAGQMRQLVVLRMKRQRHERREPTGFILQFAQPTHVIHAVMVFLNVADQHRAGRTSAHLVPRAVDIEPLLRRLFRVANHVANFRIENLRAAAGQRTKPRLAQRRQRLRHAALADPREMQNLDCRKRFQVQIRVELLQLAQHLHVVVPFERRMQSADDVNLSDAELECFLRLSRSSAADCTRKRPHRAAADRTNRNRSRECRCWSN